MSRKLFTFLSLLLCLAFSASQLLAQDSADPKKPATASAPEARAKNGKRLLSALDLMKVANVGAPRISPDGSRVAYTVGEVRMEKDKEWKTVTQIWIVPAAGGKAMQYTRGDKSSTAPASSSSVTLTASSRRRQRCCACSRSIETRCAGPWRSLSAAGFRSIS